MRTGSARYVKRCYLSMVMTDGSLVVMATGQRDCFDEQGGSGAADRAEMGVAERPPASIAAFPPVRRIGV